jgi:HAD superfamily phosphoserine phosphatase-like hydrolase
MEKTLVLFDFDGTITKKDSFPLFFKFTFGYVKFLLGFLLHTPHFILFKIGIISAENMKEIILSYFLKGKSKQWINNKGSDFINHLHHIGIIKETYIDEINIYIKNGATISVVSASLSVWLEPFCSQYEIACLCTELDFENDKFIGKFKTKNCNGLEKKKRILEKYNISLYNKIIVYGDSAGDNEMMELATLKKWVN